MTIASGTPEKIVGGSTGAYRWYVVGVLLMVAALAFLDRQAMSFLVVPMQGSLGISDTQAGILLGPAFIVFYAIASVPMGYLADRYSRRGLLIAGISIWSASTAASGLASSFEMLALARAGIGLGEACLIPATFSLVADYFRPDERGRANAIITIGNSFGAGGAQLGGGLALAAMATLAGQSLPIVGAREAWQLVLIAFSLIGALVVLLVATVREPARKSQDRPAAPAAGGLLPFVRSNWLALILVLTPYALLQLMQNATVAWLPTLFTRRFQMEPADAAILFGILLLVIIPPAAIAGGIASDWLARRSRYGRYLFFPLVAPLIAPAILLIAFGQTIWVTCIGVVLLNIVGGGLYNTIYSVVQEISPSRVLGRLLGLYSLLATLFAVGVGPTLVAVLTQHLFHRPEDLNLSLVVVVLPCLVIAMALAFPGLNAFRRLRDAAAAEQPQSPV